MRYKENVYPIITGTFVDRLALDFIAPHRIIDLKFHKQEGVPYENEIVFLSKVGSKNFKDIIMPGLISKLKINKNPIVFSSGCKSATERLASEFLDARCALYIAPIFEVPWKTITRFALSYYQNTFHNQKRYIELKFAKNKSYDAIEAMVSLIYTSFI